MTPLENQSVEPSAGKQKSKKKPSSKGKSAKPDLTAMKLSIGRAKVIDSPPKPEHTTAGHVCADS